MAEIGNSKWPPGCFQLIFFESENDTFTSGKEFGENQKFKIAVRG